jgi:hypothetical protein
MRARLIHEVGTRYELRVCWDMVSVNSIRPCDECPEGHPDRTYLNDCKNAYGKGGTGSHEARSLLRETAYIIGSTDATPDRDEKHPREAYPGACAHCGTAVPQQDGPPRKLGETGPYVHRQVFTSRLYDSPTGRPEPGDLYRVSFHDVGHCPYWDNCDGVHLHGVCPNGEDWDIDSRCSNCTMRGDRTHRCWVKSGTPEDGSLHVGKGGHTCAAGAGSIQVSGWHGFLHGMQWNQC